MKKAVRISSPAKLNLHLDVREKREDGYHTVSSIFQMVSFADELSVGSLKKNDVCLIHGDFDFDPSRNTITKAVSVFRRETGIRTGVRFQVLKRIPCGTGTGGGSSNAAAALTALDLLFGTGFDRDRLRRFAAEIGSDVPFFTAAPAAYVTGRGEVLEPLVPRADLYALVLFPFTGVETARAYRLLDAARGGNIEPEIPAGELIRSYSGEAPGSWPFFNSFFEVVSAELPELRSIRDDLYRAGAQYAAMSGSGSAMFGVFPSLEAAREAVPRVRGTYRSTVVCKLLDRLPNAVLQLDANDGI